MGDYNVLGTPTLAIIPKGIRKRDTLHPFEWVKVRAVWPPGYVLAGNASSATATTVTDSTKTWTVDQWKYYWVKCVASGALYTITSNTATRLTLWAGEVLTDADLGTLGAGGAYQIGPFGPVESLELDESQFGMLNPVTANYDVPALNYGFVVAGSVDSADPLLESVVVATNGANHSLTITASAKAAMATRMGARLLGSYLGVAYDYTVPDFLKRVLPNGLGASLGAAENVEEFRQNADTFGFWNPTHGGSEMRPHGDNDRGLPVRAMPSHPIPGAFLAVGGEPGIAKIRGAVIPLEWDATGRIRTAGDKGCDNNTYALFWRQRQAEAFDPHIGGRLFLHRCVQWQYDPAAWDYTQYGAVGSFLWSIGAALGVYETMFQEAYWVDPTTGTTVQFPSTFGASTSAQWSAEDWISRYYPNGAGGGAPEEGLSPFPNGYGAVLFRQTTGPNAGFTIGFAVKLRNISNDPIETTARTSELAVAIGRGIAANGDPVYDDPRFVVATCTAATFRNPPVGWTGLPFHVFIGPWNAAVPTIQEAWSSGLLDLEAPPETILAPARVGTELEGFVSTYSVPAPSLSLHVPLPVLSGGAAFVVETGAGLADANSMCSVEVADAFHAENGDPTEWRSATLDEKQAALRRGTKEGTEVAYAWKGQRLSQAQALSWPRYGVVDENGYSVAFNVIPLKVQQNAAVYALRVRQGFNLAPDVTTASTTGGSQSANFGPFSVSVSAGSTSVTKRRVIEADRLVRGLVVPPEGPRWLTRA